MPPSANFYQVVNSPDYQQGYIEGFEDAKRMYEKRLKAIIKEVKEIEPFSTVTSSATSTLKSNLK